ncbi:MAG: hypothetical protein KAT90_00515 [Gammaproteobacteria bacterium]|nr:hypothetical protein [Gammaproteobacteria bacterium]
MKLLRTNNGFYVQALRGVVFVTWVAEADKEFAFKIPDEKAEFTQKYVFSATGIDTEIVDV